MVSRVLGQGCRKWVDRFLADGVAGLRDRSSAPHRVANRTDDQTVELLAALRRLRFTAPELADLLHMPCSTISAVLKRLGLGKLGRLGLERANRYERARPGELIHNPQDATGGKAARAAIRRAPDAPWDPTSAVRRPALVADHASVGEGPADRRCRADHRNDLRAARSR